MWPTSECRGETPPENRTLGFRAAPMGIEPSRDLRWYRLFEQPVGNAKVDFATPLDYRPMEL